jgi:hypothetical protein
MDFKEYKQLYQQLLSREGREEIGDDPKNTQKLEAKINKFLEVYPETVPKDKKKDTPFHLLSLKEIFHRTMMVGIDIIHDISDILSQREMLGTATVRRQIFHAFTKPERRVYMGIWLLSFAFIILFIEGSS